MMQAINRAMSSAAMERVDFDVWLLGFQGDACPACGRTYTRSGWLMHHLRRTGHWRTAVQPKPSPADRESG